MGTDKESVVRAQFRVLTPETTLDLHHPFGKCGRPMPTDDAGSDKEPRRRARTVIIIPTENNRIYGDDVPLFWREAARQIGMTARAFYQLLEQREVTYLKLGRRIAVQPSAIRDYLKRQERLAL